MDALGSTLRRIWFESMSSDFQINSFQHSFNIFFRHLDVLRLNVEVGVFPNLFMSKNVVKNPHVSDAL